MLNKALEAVLLLSLSSPPVSCKQPLPKCSGLIPLVTVRVLGRVCVASVVFLLPYLQSSMMKQISAIGDKCPHSSRSAFDVCVCHLQPHIPFAKIKLQSHKERGTRTVGGQRGGQPGRGSRVPFDAPETESREAEMVSG